MSKITALLNSCAAVVALSLAVPSAANAVTMSFSSSGTIYKGYDSNGIFGAVGDLAGQTFSQVLTIDPTAYSNSVDYMGFGTEYYGANTGIAATDTVTVNGVTRAFTWNLSLYNYGESILANYQTDLAFQYQLLQGYTTDGNSLAAYINSASTPNLLNSGVISGGFYLANLANGGAVYLAYSNNAPVPEPETYAMLLAGLGLLGFTTRRRKGAAA